MKEIWSQTLLSERNIEQTVDIIHTFYQAKIHLCSFEEREFHLPRYIRCKYINDVPVKDYIPQFNEAVQLFAKIINILFEANWRLKKHDQLKLLQIVESVFRSGHDNATVVRIMFHYLEKKDSIKLGYRIKGKV